MTSLFALFVLFVDTQYFDYDIEYGEVTDLPTITSMQEGDIHGVNRFVKGLFRQTFLNTKRSKGKSYFTLNSCFNSHQCEHFILVDCSIFHQCYEYEEDVGDADEIRLQRYLSLVLFLVCSITHEMAHIKRNDDYNHLIANTPIYDGCEGGYALELRVLNMALRYTKKNPLEARFVYASKQNKISLASSVNPIMTYAEHQRGIVDGGIECQCAPIVHPRDIFEIIRQLCEKCTQGRFSQLNDIDLRLNYSFIKQTRQPQKKKYDDSDRSYYLDRCQPEDD